MTVLAAAIPSKWPAPRDADMPAFVVDRPARFGREALRALTMSLLGQTVLIVEDEPPDRP